MVVLLFFLVGSELKVGGLVIVMRGNRKGKVVRWMIFMCVCFYVVVVCG